MKKKKSNIKHYMNLIIGPILSLVSFVIAYYLDPLNYETHSSLAAIPAFLLSVIILIITQIISIDIEVEKMSRNSEQIYEDVKNCLHVTKMGTPQSAWKYVINRLSVLEYVQNTSFNFEDEIEQTNERLYTGEAYEKSFNEIAKQINKGLNWKDIGDSTAITRFRSIKDLVSEKAKKHYSFRLIKQTEPQIGFILLTYKDGTKEVLFNWDFRNIPQDPVVLLSRDQEIFNMFAAQYKSLWHVAVNDYDNSATKSTS